MTEIENCWRLWLESYNFDLAPIGDPCVNGESESALHVHISSGGQGNENDPTDSTTLSPSALLECAEFTLASTGCYVSACASLNSGAEDSGIEYFAVAVTDSERLTYKPSLLCDTEVLEETKSHARIQLWSLDRMKLRLIFDVRLPCSSVRDLQWAPLRASDYWLLERGILGVIAAASGDGHLFLFSVPHPSVLPDRERTIIIPQQLLNLTLETLPSRAESLLVSKLAFSPNGMVLAAGFATGEIAIWNLEAVLTGTLTPSNFWPAHDSLITCLEYTRRNISCTIKGAPTAYSPNGECSFLLLSGGLDGRVRLWDARDAPSTCAVLYRARGAICSLIFAHRWGCAIIGDHTGSVKLANYSSAADTRRSEDREGLPISNISCGLGAVRALSVYSSKPIIASGGDDGTIATVNLANLGYRTRKLRLNVLGQLTTEDEGTSQYRYTTDIGSIDMSDFIKISNKSAVEVFSPKCQCNSVHWTAEGDRLVSFFVNGLIAVHRLPSSL